MEHEPDPTDDNATEALLDPGYAQGMIDYPDQPLKGNGRMTKQQAKDEQTVGKLLSPEAREACERISAGEAYWSQRAAALLALDEGATAAEAGRRAGLGRRQVRFWLGRFRDDDLDIFPEAELSRTLPVPSQEKKASPRAVGEGGAATAEKSKKKKKKKKKKKGQKTRKAKKAKGTSGRSDKKSKKKGKK